MRGRRAKRSKRNASERLRMNISKILHNVVCMFVDMFFDIMLEIWWRGRWAAWCACCLLSWRAPTHSGKTARAHAASRGPSRMIDIMSCGWAPRGATTWGNDWPYVCTYLKFGNHEPSQPWYVVKRWLNLRRWYTYAAVVSWRGPGASYLGTDLSLGMVRRVPSLPLLSLCWLLKSLVLVGSPQARSALGTPRAKWLLPSNHLAPGRNQCCAQCPGMRPTHPFGYPTVGTQIWHRWVAGKASTGDGRRK